MPDLSDEHPTPRVLFVDDEQGVRALAQDMLSAAGCAVSLAEDGEQAIKTLARECFDIAVIDILMPNKEGVETIIEIGQRWPDLPILAISGGGYVSPEDLLELAEHVGAHGVLQKPFRTDQLLSAIVRTLAKAWPSPRRERQRHDLAEAARRFGAPA